MYNSTLPCWIQQRLPMVSNTCSRWNIYHVLLFAGSNIYTRIRAFLWMHIVWVQFGGMELFPFYWFRVRHISEGYGRWKVWLRSGSTHSSILCCLLWKYNFDNCLLACCSIAMMEPTFREVHILKHIHSIFYNISLSYSFFLSLYLSI